MKKRFILGICALALSITLNAQTFEYKNTGTDFLLMSMSAPTSNNNSIAYAGGSQYTSDNAPGIIVKTEDAGETWETIYEGHNIQTIAFPTLLKGFAGGYWPTLRKTEDGGETWQEVEIGGDVFAFKTIRFYNENIGMALYLSQDFELEIRTTKDGGETWSLSSNPPQHGIQSVSYADESTLYAVGYNQTIYKSMDAGDTWNLLEEGGMDIHMAVAFKDAENGIYAGEEGDLYLTYDGGQTWGNPLYTGYHHFFGLAYKENYIIAAGTDEAIYMSQNNGESFELVFGDSGENQLYEVVLFEDNSGLICGSFGTMIKFSDVIVLGTENLDKSQVSIYPNPTADFVQIKNNQIITQIELLDFSGKVISSKNSQSLQDQLDLTSYPKGIYILRINSKGKTTTHKIIKK